LIHARGVEWWSDQQQPYDQTNGHDKQQFDVSHRFTPANEFAV
jgi:hypothetical protein